MYQFDQNGFFIQKHCDYRYYSNLNWMGSSKVVGWKMCKGFFHFSFAIKKIFPSHCIASHKYSVQKKKLMEVSDPQQYNIGKNGT